MRTMVLERRPSSPSIQTSRSESDASSREVNALTLSLDAATLIESKVGGEELRLVETGHGVE